MGTPMIGYGNLADNAIFSGGSWREKLPLSNLGEPTLGRLARSTNADPNSTWFDIDVGQDHIVRVFALSNHNMRTTAQYRLKGSNDPTFGVVTEEIDWRSVWPSVYPMTQREWESDNFWFGSYKQDEIEGYTFHLIILLHAPRRLRYWRLELDDSGNPDGYIQAGRVFVSDIWQPSNSAAYGASIQWEDPTTLIETLSGAEYPDEKRPYRIARLTTHFMPNDEAYSKAFEVQRRSGRWKEVLYIHDPDDTYHAIRRRWLGRLLSLGPIANPYPNAHDVSWEIKERLP